MTTILDTSGARMQLSKREEEHDILFGVINRFIGYFTRMTVSRTSNDTSKEYPFVAMDTRQAYEQLRVALEYLQTGDSWERPIRFLDIGCGIGNILLLAELMDCAVSGIEKDVASSAIARQLVGEEAIIHDDLWSFTSYGDFDIVYYFRPFSEKTMQLRFESMIEEKMRPGAILIANRRMGSGLDEDRRFCRLDASWPIWRKNIL